MRQSEILNLLEKVEIFKNIPGDLLQNLADKIEVLTFSEGEPVINKGDEGNSMFIIGSGKVKIHDGEHIVARMESGNFFGEFSLLDEAPRSMSVSSLSEIVLLKISRELFYKLLQSRPEVAKKIISALTNRLRKQNEAIISQLKTREEELTRLVDERTRELQLRNREITEKNREITDNVNYAKRIQTAILPEEKFIGKFFKEYFILYLPKDIVSGDFYSFFHRDKKALIIAADCTGHGVTGAFLSVVGNSLLNQIINERQIDEPGQILDQLHEAMISTLNQRHGDSTDGMDAAICNFDFDKNLVHYSGANRPMWLIRNEDLIQLPPNKFPVGGMQILHEENFKSHTIQLKENDLLYIFTDGFADQFGGERGKKLMTKKFREILLSIRSLNMPEQKLYLKNAFDEWKGVNEQVDDVLVIGIRI